MKSVLGVFDSHTPPPNDITCGNPCERVPAAFLRAKERATGSRPHACGFQDRSRDDLHSRPTLRDPRGQAEPRPPNLAMMQTAATRPTIQTITTRAPESLMAPPVLRSPTLKRTPTAVRFPAPKLRSNRPHPEGAGSLASKRMDTTCSLTGRAHNLGVFK